MTDNTRDQKNADKEPDAEFFLHLVERTITKHSQLTPVQGAILVAAKQEIARDSRTFARLFGMAHAIVLRELNALVQSTDLLTVTRRDARTMRTHYQPVKSKNGTDRVVQ